MHAKTHAPHTHTHSHINIHSWKTGLKKIVKGINLCHYVYMRDKIYDTPFTASNDNVIASFVNDSNYCQ